MFLLLSLKNTLLLLYAKLCNFELMVALITSAELLNI